MDDSIWSSGSPDFGVDGEIFYLHAMGTIINIIAIILLLHHVKDIIVTWISSTINTKYGSSDNCNKYNHHHHHPAASPQDDGKYLNLNNSISNYNILLFKTGFLLCSIFPFLGNLLHLTSLKCATTKLAFVGRLFIGFGRSDVMVRTIIIVLVPSYHLIHTWHLHG